MAINNRDIDVQSGKEARASSKDPGLTAWQRGKSLLEAFEEAWRCGRPCLDDFIPTDLSVRDELLIELIRVDMSADSKWGRMLLSKNTWRLTPNCKVTGPAC
jgi:hypothetical protein